MTLWDTRGLPGTLASAVWVETTTLDASDAPHTSHRIDRRLPLVPRVEERAARHAGNAARVLEAPRDAGAPPPPPRAVLYELFRRYELAQQPRAMVLVRPRAFRLVKLHEEQLRARIVGSAKSVQTTGRTPSPAGSNSSVWWVNGPNAMYETDHILYERRTSACEGARARAVVATARVRGARRPKRARREVALWWRATTRASRPGRGVSAQRMEPRARNTSF